MKTILDTIKENKVNEVRELRKKYRYIDFEEHEFFKRPTLSLKKRLHENDFGIIAELKRKSPSAGEIKVDVDIESQAKMYAQGGAAGISCLTDSRFFGGSNEDLMRIRSLDIPILRKEFIIDEIQLFEAKAIGADVILLIAELLSKEEALHLSIMAQHLGLEVLMEFHDLTQLTKINEHVDIIGVNNRNLHTQTTDVQTSIKNFPYLPKDKVLISESGIRSIDDLDQMKYCGFKGALVGEFLMKHADPESFLRGINSQLNSYVG